jgi:hypothetical protein
MRHHRGPQGVWTPSNFASKRFPLRLSFVYIDPKDRGIEECKGGGAMSIVGRVGTAAGVEVPKKGESTCRMRLVVGLGIICFA